MNDKILTKKINQLGKILVIILSILFFLFIRIFLNSITIITSIFLSICLGLYFSIPILIIYMEYHIKKYEKLVLLSEFGNDFEYYREMLKEYPLGFIMEGTNVSQEDKLVAILLKMKLDKKIEIYEDGKIKVICNTLTKEERNILYYLKKNEEKLWNAIYEYLKYDKGKFISKEDSKISSIIAWFFLFTLLFGSISSIEVLNLLINETISLIYLIPLAVNFIIILVLAIPLLKYENKGEILNPEVFKLRKKLNGLKNYLKDFSIIKEREIKELQLWDYYMIYAILFNFKGILDRNVKDLYNIALFGDTSYLVDKKTNKYRKTKNIFCGIILISVVSFFIYNMIQHSKNNDYMAAVDFFILYIIGILIMIFFELKTTNKLSSIHNPIYQHYCNKIIYSQLPKIDWNQLLDIEKNYIITDLTNIMNKKIPFKYKMAALVDHMLKSENAEIVNGKIVNKNMFITKLELYAIDYFYRVKNKDDIKMLEFESLKEQNLIVYKEYHTTVNDVGRIVSFAQKYSKKGFDIKKQLTALKEELKKNPDLKEKMIESNQYTDILLALGIDGLYKKKLYELYKYLRKRK